MKISPVLSIFQVRAEMDVTVLVLEWQEALSLRQDDCTLFLVFPLSFGSKEAKADCHGNAGEMGLLVWR